MLPALAIVRLPRVILVEVSARGMPWNSRTRARMPCGHACRKDGVIGCENILSYLVDEGLMMPMDPQAGGTGPRKLRRCVKTCHRSFRGIFCAFIRLRDACALQGPVRRPSFVAAFRAVCMPIPKRKSLMHPRKKEKAKVPLSGGGPKRTDYIKKCRPQSLLLCDCVFAML